MAWFSLSREPRVPKSDRPGSTGPALARCRCSPLPWTDGTAVAGMSGTTPLAELLQALAPPLEYLAADDFRRVQHTHLPLPALADRAPRARAAASPAAAAPPAQPA